MIKSLKVLEDILTIGFFFSAGITLGTLLQVNVIGASIATIVFWIPLLITKLEKKQTEKEKEAAEASARGLIKVVKELKHK